MDLDIDKIDQVILALLYHNTFDDGGVLRAWKTFDWDTMDRLHEKGYISDPKIKAKSEIMTEKGQEKSCSFLIKKGNIR